MNLKETIADALASISHTAGADTVIGESITTANGTTIIPVSKVALGYASGGIDGAPSKEPQKGGPQNAPQRGTPQGQRIPPKGDSKFIGGGGTGLTVSPVAFLVVSPEGNVELLNINQPTPQASDPISSLIGAIERSPELIEKFRTVFAKDKKEKGE